MKKEGTGKGPLIRAFIGGVYKAIGFWFCELKTRLLKIRVRNDSWSIVVFERGIVTEVIV